MSHFTVTVRLPAALSEAELEGALAKAMLPYKEYGCGSDDPEELNEFLVFEDKEDDYHKEYETDGAPRVRMPDGRLLWPWDETFRVPGTFGVGRDTHKVPAPLKEEEIPFTTLYATFEDFMKGYHGSCSRDPKKGRYGHWHNPNDKWDWYVIGGRWSGHFPVGNPANGGTALAHTDITRIAQIQFGVADAQAERAMADFWRDWDRLVAGEKMDPWDGPRRMALDIGILRCVDANQLTGSEWKKFAWPDRDRYDVLIDVPADERPKYVHAFDPLATWARLDSQGWYAPGRTGWWGMHDATPESYLKTKAEARLWLRAGDQNDWVILVDCHI